MSELLDWPVEYGLQPERVGASALFCAAVTIGRSAQMVGCHHWQDSPASSRRRFFTDEPSPHVTIRIGDTRRLEFNEAFNRHDVAGMMQPMSDDCIFENTGPAPDGAVYWVRKL